MSEEQKYGPRPHPDLFNGARLTREQVIDSGLGIAPGVDPERVPADAEGTAIMLELDRMDEGARDLVMALIAAHNRQATEGMTDHAFLVKSGVPESAVQDYLMGLLRIALGHAQVAASDIPEPLRGALIDVLLVGVSAGVVLKS